ncbi:MAG: alpha-amylase family protein [Acetobacteraceae bacterium]
MGESSAWIRHAIFWHVYPLGFTDAEPAALPNGPVHHRLRHIIDWMDYAVRLGCSGLLLGPVFAASTHGYDTIDHFRIDSRLGDEADFDALIAAARARGLRVVLDGVFNHVGRAFGPFQSVLRDGPGSPACDWFRLTWPPGSQAGEEPQYATFEGHHDLVALNHDSAAVRDYVARVMTYWLDRGASGWRLDAAYAVPPTFWASALPLVRQAHPDAWCVGEVIHGDYGGFVRDSTVDSVTQYELWKAIWSALNDRNLFELAWALDRHNGFLDAFSPLTFVGNHDVTRLASQLDDTRHVAHALAILLTVGGVPCIYAGDEQGFRGVKEHRAGGDDAIRPAFPPTPDGLAPFGWPTYRLHQDLIGLRRRHPWLHSARTKALHVANHDMLLETRSPEGRLIVASNVGDTVVVRPVPGARVCLAGDGKLAADDTPDARLTVPGHGWAVLSA